MYNNKQKVFALSYLLTTPDGVLLSFLFGKREGGGVSLAYLFLFIEDRADTLIEQSYFDLISYSIL